MSDREHHGGGYMSGLMMGAIMGAAAVFFLGTKEGKRMAKVMHKKGGKTLKDLEKLVDDIEVKGEKFAQEAKVVTKKIRKTSQIKANRSHFQSQEKTYSYKKTSGQGPCRRFSIL